jgi:hypothetical protein
MIYTIPWIPTKAFPHPWARAYGSNVAEALTAALTFPFRNRVASALAAAVVGRKLGEQQLSRAEAWVRGVVNWVTTPLLDWTSWSGIVDYIIGMRWKLGLSLWSWNSLGAALYR